ncbi:unnamed protein product [Ophioblennius macclurei]
MEPQNGTKPLFTFAVIADIQYADMEDGYNFTRSSRRYYRGSLRLLGNAQRRWKEEDEEEDGGNKPGFLLQLGDIIDGFNKRDAASDRALETVLAQLRSGGPAEVHHVWGNHEFYNFSRKELLGSELNSSHRGTPAECPGRPDVYAYHFSPHAGFRFVVLDAYDVSLLGREEGCEEYRRALSLIRNHNQNQDLNCPPEDCGLQQRFTMFNGGFSQDQLDWLDSVLSTADENQEKVTIVSHLPVHPDSTALICLAWNYDDLLAVIRSHRSVVCYMAGHDHDGGYCRDKATGVHHLTFEGVIETPPDLNAFGTVFVYEDRMVLKGGGRTRDRQLLFRDLQQPGESTKLTI